MSDAPAADVGSAKTPADFLKSIRGKPVVVKLNSGVDYRGILACLDGYMNIAMEQTEVRPASPARPPRVAPRGERTPPRVATDPLAPPRHSATLNPRVHPPAPPLPPPISGHPANPKSTSSILRSIPRRASQEYVNGQLKNKYGDAFIRGNNVLYISTVKGK
jgi:small nuclear ribonucleoprotein (snRNP)-like protein